MATKNQEALSASLIHVASSDVIYDYICQSCNEDGKVLEAVGYCVECSEFLCDDCFRCHLKPRIARHHKLLDIEDAKKDANLSGCLDICTEKCSQHMGKTIEHFCVDHECLGCEVCFNLDHRNCQGVQNIPEIAKDMGSGEEFSTLIRELEKLLIQTKDIATSSRGKKLKPQDIFDKALSHVKQVKQEVNEVLNKLEKDLEMEAERMKKHDMMKMEGNIKSCDKIQTKAQNLSIDMKALQKKEQYCNLFVAMKTTNTEMRSIVKSLEDIAKDNTISNYLFQPSEQLENFIKHDGSLGKLCMNDEIQTRATKVGGINVKMDSDSKACFITGMALITGGRLAAADYSNNKVKLIDIKQSKVISEYKLPCHPYDVTTTDETGEAAVTLPTPREIVLLRVRGDRLYEHKKIKTTDRCYGIAYIKDKFVVSLVHQCRLEIIDTHGNVLQTIEKNGNGKQLFSDIPSIAISQYTDTIYVPDCDKGTVTRLSLSGHVLGIYEDSDLVWPRYVTVVKGGAVYVCGARSHNIHQVTADCKKISIPLTRKDGLDWPRSLSYDGNTYCLYVGQQFTNTVLIYKLL